MGDTSFIPWYGKLIIIIGLLYGSLYCFMGLFYGLKMLVIRNGAIHINQLLALKKRDYSFAEIERIKERKYNEPKWAFNGLEVKFKNGDKYDFISYNYLNYKKLKQYLTTLKNN